MMDYFDQLIDEGRARFRIAQAKRNALALDATATSAVTTGFSASAASRVAKMQKALDTCGLPFDKATESTKPAEPAPEVGSQLALARKWREEFRLLRAGQAARQAHGGGVFEAGGAHRLPVYRVEGGA